MRVIERVIPETDKTLTIHYRGGHVVHYDMNPVIAEGGVWRGLQNSAIFAKVSVGGAGRFISWPGDLDLCADAIWEEVHFHSI